MHEIYAARPAYEAALRRWSQAEPPLDKIGLPDATSRLGQEVEKSIKMLLTHGCFLHQLFDLQRESMKKGPGLRQGHPL
jgi:hypothetical protein